MPDFNVILSNSAEKGLRDAQPKIKERLKEALDFLKINPVSTQDFDVTKISGSYANYRIRIGRFRILYTILWEEKVIKVFDIGIRKERSYD